MTRSGIEGKKRRIKFIEKIKAIDSNTSLSHRIKDKRMREAVDTEHRYMGRGITDEQSEQDSDTKPPRIAPSTYKKQLSYLRSDVKKLNLEDFKLRKNIEKMGKKYPDFDFSLLDVEMPELRENRKTVINNAKKYKNNRLITDLKKIHFERGFYYNLRPPENVTEYINNFTDEKNSKLHQNPKTITRQRIEELLSDLPTSNHWVDLTVFIGLSTGRRPTEILKSGSFKAIDDNHLLFNGQLKTRNTDNSEPYPIPCYVKTDIIIDAFNRMKKSLGSLVDDLDNDGVNYATSRRLNNCISRLLDSESVHHARDKKNRDKADNDASKLEEFTFKDSRIIYSLLAETFKGKESLPEFRKMILGHSNLDSQVDYNKVNIIDDTEIIEEFTPTTDIEKPKDKNIEALEKLDSKIKNHPQKVLSAIHEYVKDSIEKDPNSQITQSFLTRSKKTGGAGFGRPAVKEYLIFAGFKK